MQQKPNNKDESEDCAVPKKTKKKNKRSLHCLSSDPNIRTEWMDFIFNDDPDHVSKNVILPWIRLQTRYNSKWDFQKVCN